MSVAPEDVRPSFNPALRRHRFCCVHVRLVAKLLLFLEIFWSWCVFVWATVTYIEYKCCSRGGVGGPRENGSADGDNKDERRDNEARNGWLINFGELDWGVGNYGSIIDRDNRSETDNDNRSVPTSASGGLAAPTDLNKEVTFTVYIFVYVVVTITVALALYGIKTSKVRCMLPQVFIQAFSTVIFLVVIIAYSLPKQALVHLPASRWKLVVLFVLAFVYRCICLSALIKCYCYVRARKRATPLSLHMPTTLVEYSRH